MPLVFSGLDMPATAVSQSLYLETNALKWLFPQGKATFRKVTQGT
jgi:hypothetical protein